MLTLVEAAGLVSADVAFDAALRQLDLEHALQITFAGRIARGAGISSRPLVATDKNVFLKFGHGLSPAMIPLLPQRTRLPHREFGAQTCQLTKFLRCPDSRILIDFEVRCPLDQRSRNG